LNDASSTHNIGVKSDSSHCQLQLDCGSQNNGFCLPNCDSPEGSSAFFLDLKTCLVEPVMPISDLHAENIISTQATFGFSNFECGPERITHSVGFDPDGCRIKGQTKVKKSGKKILIPFSSWWIESSVESKDINEHLRQLINRLAEVSTPFPEDFGDVGFGVVWKGNYLYAGSGPFYESDVIEAIARFRATLWQDIYQIDDATEK